MVLRAIEAHIRTSKSEAVTLPEVLTVEHLLPQKGALSDYTYADPMPVQTGETAERCRERLIHTLGNLTLLTTELNASVSNGPFPGKCSSIAANSDLRLNAWLRADPPHVWSEASIIARGEALFKAAREIWRRAEGEPGEVDEDSNVSASKGEWKFSDPADLNARRAAVIAAFEAHENVRLTSVTIAKRRNADGSVRVVVPMSKMYADRGHWYAHHPDWDAYLSEAEKGFLLLGCLEREVAFAIPQEVLRPLLDSLNVTVRPDTGKSHWHIHLAERNGTLELLLPKTETTLNLDPYRLDAPALTPAEGAAEAIL